jgi:fatty-acid peroxygenase
MENILFFPIGRSSACQTFRVILIFGARLANFGCEKEFTMFDSTLHFLRDPYRFISRKCRELKRDAFHSRLFLKKTIFMSGPEAAKVFYDPDKFVRAGAAAEPLKATLLGKGGVQGMDAEAHRVRKKLLMGLMTKELKEELIAILNRGLESAGEKWSHQREIVLYDELQLVLTEAVCAWAGIPITERELPKRSRQLAALFDSAGAKGWAHFKSRWARRNAERWIEKLVREMRQGDFADKSLRPAQAIAFHLDEQGFPLSARDAAVEILNILRPTVAVSLFMVDAAHALHMHPECQRKWEKNEDDYVDLFLQEIRRYYPFFPAVMAKVKESFQWQGLSFQKGQRVILDLYGTNQDKRTWTSPREFRPERFRRWDHGLFNFIPQGGGTHSNQHRCAGEFLTLDLMKAFVDFMIFRLEYHVPEQDLKLKWSRLPAIPGSRFRMTKIRMKPRPVAQAEVPSVSGIAVVHEYI